MQAPSAKQSLYFTLASTAHAHIHSLRPATPGSNNPNPTAIRALLHDDYTTDFGHALFVSTTPHLQGSKDEDEFIEHLGRMAARLQTYTLDVIDTCVDAEKRTVILRVLFRMMPRAGEVVGNDMVFWLTMDDRGKKVVKCTEFLDAVATRELGKTMHR